MKIKVAIRSRSFQKILDAKLKQSGFYSELVDMEKPLISQLADANVIVNGSAEIDKEIINACPNLELVHQAGIGYDNVDVPSCTSRSVYVANVPLANSIAVAEHAIFLMMLLAKNMQTDGIPNRMEWRAAGTLGSELAGKTLLIIGLGASGSEVAKRAHAFGMRILALTKDPIGYTQSAEKAFSADLVKGPEGLNDFIQEADYISLHLPLNAETKGMIGKAQFDLMKKSAFFINVARAAIVDKEALFESLKEKRIAGAAFDVFWQEPAPPEEPLFQLENFVLTPHIAGWTKESVDAIAGVIAVNIVRIADGKAPLTLVNSELANR